MECKEAQNLIPRYISKEMKEKELELFLEHIKTCKMCYEELEINYTINAALLQLDDNQNTSYDMNEMLLEELNASRKYIKRKKAFYLFKNALYAVSMVALIIIIMIQIKLWM